MLSQENMSYGSFKYIFDNYEYCGNVLLPPNFLSSIILQKTVRSQLYCLNKLIQALQWGPQYPTQNTFLLSTGLKHESGGSQALILLESRMLSSWVHNEFPLLHHKCHKFSNEKQHSFLLSRFCRWKSRHSGLGSLPRPHVAEPKFSRAGLLSGCSEEESVSRIIQNMGRIQFPVTIGQRSIFPW